MDRLAKFGTTSGWLHKVPIAWSRIKLELRNRMLQTWYKRWWTEKTCRQTRLLLPCYFPQFTKDLWKLNRHNISRMVQFITGHNYLRYHLYNVSKSDTKVCRNCGTATETAWHLLTECPSLTVIRYMQFFEDESFSLPRSTKLQHMVLYTSIASLMEHPDASNGAHPPLTRSNSDTTP